MKGFLGWSSGGPPTQLIDTQTGKLISKPLELANLMNNFFIDKVKKLRENIPHTVGNPIDRIKALLKNRSCTFSLKPVHPDVIKEIIEKLTNKKSCG